MLLVVFAAGCSIWRPLPGGALAHPVSESLGQTRVILRNGTEFELEHTMISRDSIIGFGGETRARFAVARREVASVDARQIDAPKTFAAGGFTMLSILAAWIVAVVISLSGEAT